MDPCCSAGRLLMTILPEVLWKSPVVLGAPHLTDSNLGEACHQAAPGNNSLWCALGAARKLYHFPPATVLWTEEGLSHHLWGQLSCQLLWLAGGNSERMKLCDLEWPGFEVRKPASALVTEWVTCSWHSSQLLSYYLHFAYERRRCGGKTRLPWPLFLNGTYKSVSCMGHRAVQF